MSLINFYNRQKFFPNIVSLLINPFYFARKGLLEGIRPLASHLTGKTLDIGCGMKPYRELFKVSEYVGLEIDSKENREKKKADYYYDGKKFPFADGVFDSVLTSQVFEHVFEPDHFLDEIYRVLKPSGMMLLTVPFVWDEHEQPFDFGRYSSFGLKHILNKHGFEILEQRKSMNDIRLIFQLINAYVYKVFSIIPNVFARNILIAIFIFPFNILGELLALITPKNDDLYLDNIILVRKTVTF